MEECSPSSSKPSKLSTIKSCFQVHAAIVRSLSPFSAWTMHLESSTPTRRSDASCTVSGCVCSSSTDSAVANVVQVPALGVRANGCDTRHGSVHEGSSKAKQNSRSASQKQAISKKGFTGHFNKGYARVSDVSSIKTDVEAATCSIEARDKTQHKSADLIRIGHEKPDTSKWENSCATKFMQNYQPIVKYTCDPCMAFYESMMEMVVVRCLDGHGSYLDLEDMFACYIVLNPSQHRLHIEEAFKLLLTELYTIHELGSVPEPIISM